MTSPRRAQPGDRGVEHRRGGRADGLGAVAPDAEPGAVQRAGVQETGVVGGLARRPAAVAGSAGSGPASAASRAAASATVRAIGPAVSCAAEMGTMPVRLTRPTVGLMPTTPQAAAGETIEPSVSVPTASGASPAATAAADPELDPDGLRPAPCGLTAWPPSVLHPLLENRERKLAHSDKLALAMITAPGRAQPAEAERLRAAGLRQRRRSGRGRLPGNRHVVLDQDRDAVQRAREAPCARRASLAAASSSARGLTEMTARRPGFSRWMRSR